MIPSATQVAYPDAARVQLGAVLETLALAVGVGAGGRTEKRVGSEARHARGILGAGVGVRCHLGSDRAVTFRDAFARRRHGRAGALRLSSPAPDGSPEASAADCSAPPQLRCLAPADRRRLGPRRDRLRKRRRRRQPRRQRSPRCRRPRSTCRKRRDRTAGERNRARDRSGPAPRRHSEFHDAPRRLEERLYQA